MRSSIALLVALAALAAPAFAARPSSLRLTSASFAAGGEIPAKFTCKGADVSPALAWSGAPAGTRSFAFILDDPDAPDPAAPRTTWTHWVIYNLPATANSLAEGAGLRGLPSGTRDGHNDWGAPGYRGPCPPIGRHRYIHHLYALDTVLPDLHGPTRAALLAAMKGHVLATAELTGTFAHTGKP